MKGILHIIYSALLILLLLLLSCSESTNTETSTLTVSVKDNDLNNTPVANAQITLLPGNIIKQTNEEGLCIFDMDQGDYFINADLCCSGPGFIHYHEAVTILKGEHKEVTLSACLRCY